MGELARAGRCAALVLVVGWAGTVGGAGAGDAPPPPDSPMSRLVRKLAATKARPPTPPPAGSPKSRPELRFRKSSGWLMLPELAGKLSTNAEEKAAVLELLGQGAAATRELLAKDGLADDVAVGTAFAISQLWGFATGKEVSDPDGEVLLAQLVAAMAGPEMAAAEDADKQRYWEYCIGLPVFLMGMKEVATEASAQADLKTIASAAFAALVGVSPQLVEIGPQGLVPTAEALRAGDSPAAKGSGPGKRPSPPAVTPGRGAGDAIAYDPPAGWTREDAGWATIFRAGLGDVLDTGAPVPHSGSRHAASIFVLPPRPAPEGGGALFEALWREQLDTFELGDSFVHYRARLPSRLVVHFMGRSFRKKGEAYPRPEVYAGLWLVDLGDRVQPVTAVVVPDSKSAAYVRFDEKAAYKALSFPLGAFLDSVRPAAGAPPHPTGGVFRPGEILGDWETSSRSFGGMYVFGDTGAGAGAAFSSTGKTTYLGADGRFRYEAGGYVVQPGTSGSMGTDKNDGTFVLDGDVVRFSPRLARDYSYDTCAVGTGRVRVGAAWRRLLVLVGMQTDGRFLAPPLVPWEDAYPGVLHWMVERGGG